MCRVEAGGSGVSQQKKKQVHCFLLTSSTVDQSKKVFKVALVNRLSVICGFIYSKDDRSYAVERKRCIFSASVVQNNEQLPKVMTVNEKLKNTTYDQHKHLDLKEKVIDMKTLVNYNVPIQPIFLDIDQIRHQIEQYFTNHQNAFKINLSFGLILKNKKY